MIDRDYPAAHSMDSCWFAVDKDGRVGFFQTGEAGAQPTRGLFSRPAELAGQRIAREVPAGDYEVDLRGRLLPYLEDGGGWLRHAGAAEVPVVMFLDSLDPVRDALASGLATEVKTRDGFAVLWHTLAEADFRRLHRRKAVICRGCFWDFDLPGEADEDRPPNLGRHGVYVFTALGGNASANPYGVQLIPARPIHVDQLSPDLRRRLKEVQFAAVSFADTPVFQPAEHVPCTAYEPMYTDLNGRMHPLPDAEDMPPDEYLLRHEEMLGPDDEDPRPG
jgi:hypothetical protein